MKKTLLFAPFLFTLLVPCVREKGRTLASSPLPADPRRSRQITTILKVPATNDSLAMEVAT